MLQVISSAWALLLGMGLLMVGNGMQSTLLGVRGQIENFGTFEMSVVISAYFIGFLGGSRMAPNLIRRVGHVRVFAALASLISAVMILYPTLVNPWVWVLGRILIGFCFSAVFVTAESWLNAEATNENRGTILSIYMIAQTLGMISAQGLLMLGDASTASLFIVASILVSVSFGPILLSVSSTPAVEMSRSMALHDLVRAAPLGTVGVFFLGTIFATQAGMGPVFAAQIGLSAQQVSLFMAMLFVGPLLLQVPIGWISDRVDRRRVIFVTSALGAVFCLLGWAVSEDRGHLFVIAFLTGGVTMPLYALLLAYANDALSREDMPAASGALALTFGFGAILGPLAAGFMMQTFGSYMFWIILAATFLMIAVFALYRMTQSSVRSPDETESYLSVVPTASQVAVEAAGTWSADQSKSSNLD
jgi:MFS family permease